MKTLGHTLLRVGVALFVMGHPKDGFFLVNAVEWSYDKGVGTEVDALKIPCHTSRLVAASTSRCPEINAAENRWNARPDPTTDEPIEERRAFEKPPERIRR
jgi:hypothetical protein